MDFQSWTLCVIILVTNFFMDFEMVQSFMMFWLGTWFWLDNILRKLGFEKFCMMPFVRFYPWTFKQAKKYDYFKSP
jgi:hypothetical protein